jgi:hypothetical protein
MKVEAGEFTVVGDIPDGKVIRPDGQPLALALVGVPEFKDGKLVAFHLDLFDYAAHVAIRGDQRQIYFVSRPVADRDKTPNWPNPEPAKQEATDEGRGQ